MAVGITLILITLIVCITVIVIVFIGNQDNYSYWRIEDDLKEIKRMLEKTSKDPYNRAISDVLDMIKTTEFDCSNMDTVFSILKTVEELKKR